MLFIAISLLNLNKMPKSEVVEIERKKQSDALARVKILEESLSSLN
jgi:hypothetical protein